jgi:hypothetical protein
MRLFLSSLVLLCASGMAGAQSAVRPPNPTDIPRIADEFPRVSAESVCSKLAEPVWPTDLVWAGSARYRATALVQAGRVQQLEVKVVTGVKDRQVQRRLIHAISVAMLGSTCDGDAVIEREFSVKAPAEKTEP